jgi:hypothetical protein
LYDINKKGSDEMNFKKTASLIAVSLIFLMSGAGLLPTPACLPAANRPVRVVYADGDCTFSMSGDEIIGYDGNASSVVIPDYVRKIGTGVFSGHTELRSVAIPDSVDEIGLSAFSGCTGLSGVTLPDSVIYIHDWAFAECTGLSYMKITTHNLVK